MPWYLRKYFILMIVLTAFLLIPPFFTTADETTIMDSLFFILMLSTVYVVAHNMKLLVIGIALAVISQWGSLTTEYSTDNVFVLGLVCTLVIMLIVIVVIIRDILSTGEILVDAVFGSIAAYLLIGVAWGLLYYLIDTQIPGSIFVSADLPESSLELFGKSDFSYYSYFSLVSMTTLGYGDLVPAHPTTRALATYQAIFGQMFIAVVVSRLVALHFSSR